MSLGQPYSTGLVTVTNNSPTVTGVGVLWTDILEGDFFCCDGLVAPILADVVSPFTTITLAENWKGATHASATYSIQRMSYKRYDPALTQNKVREMLSTFGTFSSVFAPDGSLAGAPSMSLLKGQSSHYFNNDSFVLANSMIGKAYIAIYGTATTPAIAPSGIDFGVGIPKGTGAPFTWVGTFSAGPVDGSQDRVDTFIIPLSIDFRVSYGKGGFFQNDIRMTADNVWTPGVTAGFTGVLGLQVSGVSSRGGHIFGLNPYAQSRSIKSKCAVGIESDVDVDTYGTTQRIGIQCAALGPTGGGAAASGPGVVIDAAFAPVRSSDGAPWKYGFFAAPANGPYPIDAAGTVIYSGSGAVGGTVSAGRGIDFSTTIFADYSIYLRGAFINATGAGSFTGTGVPGLTVVSGASGSPTWIALGRTGAETNLSVATAGAWAFGEAAGDFVVYSLGSTWLGSAVAAKPTTIVNGPARGTTGTDDVLRMKRLVNSGVSFPQVASFALGTWGIGGSFAPGTRLDLKLKSIAADDTTADVSVMSWLDNGTVGIGVGTSIPNGGRLEVWTTGNTAIRIKGGAANNNAQIRIAGAVDGNLWAIGTDIAAGSGSRDFHIYDLFGGGAAVLTAVSGGNIIVGPGGAAASNPARVTITRNALAPLAGSLDGGTTNYLQVVGADGIVPEVTLDAIGARGAFTIRRANGTRAAPTQVLAGDQLFNIRADGWHSGGAYTGGPRVRLTAVAEENFTASTSGTKFCVGTTAPGGAISDKVTFWGSGGVSVTTGTHADPGANILRVGSIVHADNWFSIGTSGTAAPTSFWAPYISLMGHGSTAPCLWSQLGTLILRPGQNLEVGQGEEANQLYVYGNASGSKNSWVRLADFSGQLLGITVGIAGAAIMSLNPAGHSYINYSTSTFTIGSTLTGGWNALAKFEAVNGADGGYALSGYAYGASAIALVCRVDQTTSWMAGFFYAGAYAGAITTNGTGVTYATASDGRLKDQLRPFGKSGRLIDALKVYDFRWKSSGRRDVGLVAQEAYDVWSNPITRAANDNGVWMADYSKYVPVLIAEVQSLRRRVAELESSAMKIAA